MILKNADFILTIGHYYQHLLTPDIKYVVSVNLSATLMIKILWSRNPSKRLSRHHLQFIIVVEGIANKL